MKSSITDTIQTARLQTTPPSTHGTPSIVPHTVLPEQHMNLATQVGQPIIAMSANIYPSHMLSNNNIMSNCASAENV